MRAAEKREAVRGERSFGSGVIILLDIENNFLVGKQIQS